jgi:hypothetical protein
LARRDWLIIEAIIRAEVKPKQEQLISFLHHHHFPVMVVVVDQTKHPATMAVDHTTPYRPEYNDNVRELQWWHRTIGREQVAEPGVIIRVWIPGMSGAKSWVGITRKKSSQKKWVCNVMPDGKTPFSETLFIQSGLVEVDPIWDMAKDFEC